MSTIKLLEYKKKKSRDFYAVITRKTLLLTN